MNPKSSNLSKRRAISLLLWRCFLALSGVFQERHSTIIDAFSSTRIPSQQTKTTSSSTINNSINNEAPLFASHIAQKQQAQQQTSSRNDNIVLTFLEINGWLLTMNNGMTVLIDPILEGPLEFFGLSSLFIGSKRVLPATGLTELLPLDQIDCLLLTQGLEDHAHVQTLTKLRQEMSSRKKELVIVAPPSAKAALQESGWYGSSSNIRFLDHGEETKISGESTVNPLSIQATTGALVGPPWQKRENGYVLSSTDSDSNRQRKLYIEPHVEFNAKELSKFSPVDVVITPTTGQTLPAFELVHGPQDAVRLVETLQPKFVVPMPNADLDINGLAAPLVSTVGKASDFEEGLLARQRRNAIQTLPEVISGVHPGQDFVLNL